MTRIRLTAGLAAVLIGAPACALAKDDLFGRWRDNAPNGDPIGSVSIAADSIVLGRKATYRVKPVGVFDGDGELFEVTGLDRKRDPEGCGPGGKVRYLAVAPLPPIAPGVGGPAIRIFFYSGNSPPTADSIKTDPALCSIRPFSR